MSTKTTAKVWQCGVCAARQLRSSNTQARAFSSSSHNLRSVHAGNVPTFTETSSAELDALLSTFRRTVFLPPHLSKAHQKLVYSDKAKRTLSDDPVKVELSDETFSLEHIDRTKDQPSTVKGLFRAVALFRNKQDWDNLPIILQGLKDAKRNLSITHLQKLVRKAGQAGRQDVILECARRVSKTGLTLKDAGLVGWIMWWMQYKAVRNDLGLKSSARALSMAEQMSLLLEDERHAGGDVVDSLHDPRTRPEVAGILLQLAAIQANRNGGTDTEGKVKMYAERYVNLVSQDAGLQQTFPATTELDGMNEQLAHMTSIVFGLALASKVLGTDSTLGQDVMSRALVLAERVGKVYETLYNGTGEEQRASRLGLWSYQKLLSKDARERVFHDAASPFMTLAEYDMLTVGIKPVDMEEVENSDAVSMDMGMDE